MNNKEKYIITIDGIEDVSSISLNNAEIINGNGLLVKEVPTPEGVDIEFNEKVIEISNIKKGVEYRNLSILVKDEDIEPIQLSDIYLPNDELDEYENTSPRIKTKKEQFVEKFSNTKNYFSKENQDEREMIKLSKRQEKVLSRTTEMKITTENVEIFVPKEDEALAKIKARNINNAIAEEVKLTNDWLTNLAKQEVLTRELEDRIPDLETKLNLAIARADEVEATAREEDESTLKLKQIWLEAKQISESAAANASQSQEITSEEVRQKLIQDVRDLGRKENEAYSNYMHQNDVSEKYWMQERNERILVDQIKVDINEIHKQIYESNKIEAIIKNDVISNFNRKAAKSNLLTKKSWKIEERVSFIKYHAAKAEKELKELIQKVKKTLKDIEVLENKISNEKNEEEKIIAQSDLSKLRIIALNANTLARKTKANLRKFRIAESKITEKSNHAIYLAELHTEVALISKEAARKVQAMIIEEIEGYISKETLSLAEKSMLTQEVKELKEQSEEEIILAEQPQRSRLIIEDEITFAEKIIRKFFKETYWVIFKRGYKARDTEFDKFIVSHKLEEEHLLSEIKEKQEQVDKAKKEAKDIQAIAEKELEEIKLKTQQDLSSAKQEAQKEIELAKQEAQKELEEIKIKLEEEKEIARKEAEEVIRLVEIEKQQAEKEANEKKEEVKELEEALETSEKAREQAEKKAHIFDQIEEIVEDDKNN